MQRIGFIGASGLMGHGMAKNLRAKGWQPGQDYQPGSFNYNVLHEWNAASVYQQSLAVMGHQIDR